MEISTVSPEFSLGILRAGEVLMLDKINRDIETAYGSLKQPNWSFVDKRIKDGLYDDLVKEMTELGFVQETTDLNDDCSRGFAITAGTQELGLRLSLVGKYACAHDAAGRLFSKSDLVSCALGAKLLSLLQAGSVELVDEETLRTSIEFAGEKRALYEVLFSIDELIS
jgi:hypothetical protein